jgi:hypothetical protein
MASLHISSDSDDDSILWEDLCLTPLGVSSAVLDNGGGNGSGIEPFRSNGSSSSAQLNHIQYKNAENLAVGHASPPSVSVSASPSASSSSSSSSVAAQRFKDKKKRSHEENDAGNNDEEDDEDEDRDDKEPQVKRMKVEVEENNKKTTCPLSARN